MNGSLFNKKLRNSSAHLRDYLDFSISGLEYQDASKGFECEIAGTAKSALLDRNGGE
jgi:hypothetical protein